MTYILAIDQGTTSTRSIIFDKNLRVVQSSQKEITQYFPKPGWVEHDPEEIFDTVIDTVKDVINKTGITVNEIVSIGITNQRETTIIWDALSGKTLSRAIVWQDRRTNEYCKELRSKSYEQFFQEKTGLLIDPYFSATKLKWLLDKHDPDREKSRKGELKFGTIDSFLIWKLSKGSSHVSDITNASRTMMFNIKDQDWDIEILNLLDIPVKILPEVKECADEFGAVSSDFLGTPIPINGVAGDQQAATIGQACFEKGMIKSTYGTGCFALMNIGNQIVYSKNKLLTTIAYKIEGELAFALEGSIFIAGAVVQWLRDSIKIIGEAKEVGLLAKKAKDQEIYFVPAFTGLGAPYWDSEARGAIFGLLRDTGREEIALAALESIGFQTRDLLEAMRKDLLGLDIQKVKLRVDGGMTQSIETMQILADLSGVEINIPETQESTAKGVAWLAGMKQGIYSKKEDYSKDWKVMKTFSPNISSQEKEIKYSGWVDAVNKTRKPN